MNPTEMATAAWVDKIREENRSALPKAYHGSVHILLNVLLLAGALTAVGVALSSPRASDVPLVLGCLVVWSLIEYAAHRWVLHRHRRIHAALYREHSQQHHGYFTDEFMHTESHVDINRVLLRPWDVLLVEIAAAVLAGGVALVDVRLGLLFFATANLYCVAYEVLHGLYHCAWSENVPGLRAMTRHHRAHHDPTSMGRWNFAVVFPILDSIFGTSLPTTRPTEGDV